MNRSKIASYGAALAALLSMTAEAITTPKPPPTLSVAVSGTNTVLVWTPPTTNTDETPVKITGYNVYRSTTTPIKQQTGTGAPAPLVPYTIKAGTLTYTDASSASLNDYYAISAWYCDSTGCTESVTGPTVQATSTPQTPNNVTLAGTATFHWVAPMQRSDGSPLTNLAGYKLYRGLTCTTQPTVVTISNPGLLTYQDTNVPIGSYCYSLTAYDTNGLESPKSPNINVTFITPPSMPGAPGQPTVQCLAVAPQGVTVTCAVSP